MPSFMWAGLGAGGIKGGASFDAFVHMWSVRLAAIVLSIMKLRIE
jgi:hypothetical protein